MKRRTFLQTGAAAAAGACAWTLGTKRATAADDVLDVALIGVGLQGGLLLNACQGLPGIRFRALCDIWPYRLGYGQRYLARYGTQVNAYTDYRELLEKEKGLAAVLIATPDSAHAEQCNACLEAGLHVYCEAMLAHNVPAARSIVETARRTGKLVQVGYQRRSRPSYRHACEVLLSEAALPGQLVNVQTQWAQPVIDLRGAPRRHVMPDELLRRHGYENMREFRNWIWFPKHCGGPYCSFVSQQLDVCNWFLDAVPRSVTAIGGGQFFLERSNWDTVFAIYEYPGPEDAAVRVSTSLVTNSSAGEMRRYERFLGTEGTIQLSDNAAWVRVWRESAAPDWDDWLRRQFLVEYEQPQPAAADDEIVVRVSGEVERYDLPPFEERPPFQPHLQNFFQAVRGQAELHCPVETAYRSQVAVFKALEAARAGKTIALQAEDFQA